MADFVAVIRKAVNGLPENTPKNREKVYEKARNAVRRQLENMSPAPGEDVIRRQLDRLETAIGEVEIEHTEALPAIEDEAVEPPHDEPDADEVVAPAIVERVEAKPEPTVTQAGKAFSAEPSVGRRENEADVAAGRNSRAEMPATTPPAAPDALHRNDRIDPASLKEMPAGQVARGEIAREPEFTAPAAAVADPGWPEHERDISEEADGEDDMRASSPFGDDSLIGDSHDEMFGLGSAEAGKRQKRKVRRTIGLAVLCLVVLGAAYAAWANRNAMLPLVASLTSSSSSSPAQKVAPSPNSQEKAAGTPAPSTPPATPPAAQAPAATPKPAENAEKPAAGAQPANGQANGAAPDGGKFTQRLMADGSETNPGPAPAADQTAQAEGRSVSAQTAAAAAPPAAGTNAPGTPPADASKPQTAEVSQKMYLYEERFNDQAPAAVTGSVVWSLAKDTSDGSDSDLPVIHGEISVPQKGVTALITIKRNNDPSLPASHLIEIVFALPGNFEGGGIQNVQRVSLKETEQAPGNPLIAVPAKITDNFFMVALNDYPEAVKTNLDLLKSRNWIDIPVTYDNGRRALITLEKGASGADVFDRALKAWAAAPKPSDAAAPAAPTGPANKPADQTGTTPPANPASPVPNGSSTSPTQAH